MLSMARSTSRCPPYAAGSTNETRPGPLPGPVGPVGSMPQSTLPFQRSPCSRAGGSSGTRSASFGMTASIVAAWASVTAPRSRASLR